MNSTRDLIQSMLKLKYTFLLWTFFDQFGDEITSFRPDLREDFGSSIRPRTNQHVQSCVFSRAFLQVHQGHLGFVRNRHGANLGSC